ncbi:MAG TPA: acetyl-coenzyme A synthetase N-terminal domain-containing protein, partial [Chloroflexota bacterium]|nr:acetyl-coenzyme A synthetase N-terminal domain-containing protein [Chloroflexota bacterium]
MTNTVSDTSSRSGAIDALLQEDRRFPPSKEFAAQANARDGSIYAEAERDPIAFWEARAKEQVEWFKPWDKALEWNVPFAKWFVGAQLNAAYNCVDRHATGPR